MSIVAVNVRLPWSTTGVRGPLSSNTWHFDSHTVVPDQTNIQAGPFTLLGGLYIGGMDGLWSSMLTGDLEFTAYNLDDAKPRLPVAVATTTFNVEADTLPGEVSLNVGMRYPRATGVPTQRGRGTIHLGPLAQAVIGADGLATDAALDQVQNALESMITDTIASQFDLVTGTEAQGFETVERLSLTNELGTVRRRQFPATDRRLLPYT